MKLIKTREISGKIMTLFEEAEKELIIVSPYNKITNWAKLINSINKAKSKGVNICWYSRRNDVNEGNAEEVINNLAITPILVDNLHAKIYMNELNGVVTSMNMHKSSDDNSIEIGYLTETKEEYQELLDFFAKYIKNAYIENGKTTHQSASIFSNKVKPPLNTIISDEPYIQLMHGYISNKYGTYKYNYKSAEILEYFDFIRKDYKIQFIPYSAALRVQVWPPSGYSIEYIQRTMYRNKIIKRLTYEDELETIEEETGNYIKYYYYNYGHPCKWSKDTLNEFLKDLDLLIEIVFSK